MFESRVSLAKRACAIVGLPNIGKSTFFNALTASHIAKTGNYPFCTIKPNRAQAPIPDPRLEELSIFTSAKKQVPISVDVVDVAGLVENASRGAGLGNQFLNDIRPCHVIIHMLRCFGGPQLEGFDPPTPIVDHAVIQSELILADLDAAEKKLTKLKGRAAKERAFVEVLCEQLQSGTAGRYIQATNPEEQRWLANLQLLSSKPTLYVLNVGSDVFDADSETVQLVKQVETHLTSEASANTVLRICADVEEMVVDAQNTEEKMSMLGEWNISTTCQSKVLRRVHSLLGLQCFFTAGPEMVHSWSIKAGSTVRQAAGVIHTDFEKHFDYARVMPSTTFIKQRSFHAAEGLMMKVGPTHVIEDGDVFIVSHSAGAKL